MLHNWLVATSYPVLISLITKAVVATCVVLVENAAVGAVGTPVSAGLAESTTLPVPVAVAATASDGVLVELVTVGTSHAGQEPEGAAKFVTVPAPPDIVCQPCAVAPLFIPQT